jgi:hypothetical protein
MSGYAGDEVMPPLASAPRAGPTKRAGATVSKPVDGAHAARHEDRSAHTSDALRSGAGTPRFATLTREKDAFGCARLPACLSAVPQACCSLCAARTSMPCACAVHIARRMVCDARRSLHDAL